jgi:hypothetical protein
MGKWMKTDGGGHGRLGLDPELMALRRAGRGWVSVYSTVPILLDIQCEPEQSCFES